MRLKLKSSVHCGQDKKDRRVIIDIIPSVLVASLQTDAFIAIVAYFDMVTSEQGTQREVEEESSQGSVAILKEKRARLCISSFRSNEFILFYGKLKNWD